MEPQDTFDMQARTRDLVQSTFARRFSKRHDGVGLEELVAAVANDYPKQWAEWTAFAGPGASQHLPDDGFVPIRLAVDNLHGQLFMALSCAPQVKCEGMRTGVTNPGSSWTLLRSNRKPAHGKRS
ncbi:hypothetical protein AWB68_08741 [Caballeronia choica]|uniref:Uncharacterized protein n=1 Tax=Caballeronia choica TaxID=326476 RepID=A0A158L5P4_9BURK|nr:hypothetical protein [Caballeronia choica]SAL88329.1 hypothetical protein AWB68_08741 [Caballeronia choica]